MLGKRPRIVVPSQQQCHYQYKEEHRIAIHSGFSSSSSQNLSSTSAAATAAAASLPPSASVRRQVIGFEVATASSSAKSGQATTIAVSSASLPRPFCEVKRSSQGGGLTAALLSADQKGVPATDSLQSISTTKTITATTTTTTTTNNTPLPIPTLTPTHGPRLETLPVSTLCTDRKGGERGPLHVRHCRGCIFLTSSSSSSSSPASSFEDAPRAFPAIPLTPDNFLKACFFCTRPLSAGKDIYMYRGDRAFCSVECRYQQIVMDERCSAASSFKPGMPNRSSSSHCRRSRALTTATASAA